SGRWEGAVAGSVHWRVEEDAAVVDFETVNREARRAAVEPGRVPDARDTVRACDPVRQAHSLAVLDLDVPAILRAADSRHRPLLDHRRVPAHCLCWLCMRHLAVLPMSPAPVACCLL